MRKSMLRRDSVQTKTTSALYHRIKPTAVALALATCFSGSIALANPVSPTVVNGTASFATVGNILNITNSPSAIINWGSFSIGVNELTRFLQQSASSAVLNRVIGQDPSAILGALQSNGKVFLLNPNGIVFGAGSQINVAGLVASTLNLSNEDFLANRMRFTDGAGAGSVVNQGSLTGGSVYLIGKAVTNDGLITSPQGEVILAAGNSVELVNPGTPNLRVEIVAPDNEARNLGTITADAGRIGIYAGLINNSGTLNASSAVAEGGRIVLRTTKNTTLASSSILDASGATGGKIEIQSGGTTLVEGNIAATGSTGDGGAIHVLGNNVGLIGSASVDVSGATGGGTVLVGGDFQGKNPWVQNAFRTYVGSGVTIKADATQNGGGGKVIVWSDDVTRAHGTLTARGGERGGNGGFVETSGHYLDVAGIRIDVGAAKGAGGTWLLDPFNITVTAADLSITDTNATAHADFQGTAGNSTISAATIQTVLNTGSNVILDTTGGGTDVGDITVNSAITKTAGAGATLTLNAHNNINVNASITSTVGQLDMVFNADSDNLNGGAINLGTATLNANGGNIRMTANSGIAQDTLGRIIANTLTASSRGGINLAGLNNEISFFNATNTISGNVLLNNAAPLTINEISNSVGAVAVANTGDITTQNITASGAIDIAATGDLMQISGTTISNTTGAAGVNDVTLGGANMTLRQIQSQRHVMLNATGTLNLLGAGGGYIDDTFFVYNLPFAFNYFGTPYTQAYITTNGLITFGTSTSQYSDSLGSLGSYKAIAPAWNDWILDVNLGRDIRIAPGANTLTVLWDVARYSNFARTARFEAVLNRNGNIRFNYGRASESFAGDVTIGLSDGAGITLASQLMSRPNFSLNNLVSTTFTPNGAGSYTETVSNSNTRLAAAGPISGSALLGQGSGEVVSALSSLIIRAGGAITNGNGLGIVTANTLDATAAGGIALTTAVANITTSNTGIGNTAITNRGALTVGNMRDAGTITLVNDAAVTQAAGTAISAAELIAQAVGGIALNTQVANLTLNTNGGDVYVINDGSFTVDLFGSPVNGAVYASTQFGAPSASLTLGSAVSASGNLSLLSDSGMSINQPVSAGGALVLDGGLGDLNITTSSVSGDSVFLLGGNVNVGSVAGTTTTVTASGLLSIVTPGTLNVRAGSGPTTVTGMVNADVVTGGDVNVRGGSAPGTYAYLRGDPDINMIVGGTINIDIGTGGNTAYGQVIAGAPRTIAVGFPMLASGGFFVNGIENAVFDVQTNSGFLSGGLPAILGTNLLVTYGGGTVLNVPTDALIVAMGESTKPPDAEKDKDVFDDLKKDKDKEAPVCR